MFGIKLELGTKVVSFGTKQLRIIHEKQGLLRTLMTNATCVRMTFQKPLLTCYGTAGWPRRAWVFAIGIINTMKAKLGQKGKWIPLNWQHELFSK